MLADYQLVPPRSISVVGAAIIQGDRCLVARRSPAMRAPLLWEFPGGKVEPGETPEQALAREIHEELGVRIAVGPHLGRGTAGDIILDVYRAALVEGEPRAREHAELAWSSADELTALAWAAADIPIVPLLVALLRH